MSNILNFEKVLLHTAHPYAEKAPATPFIKWAGGKRSLIPSLIKYFPEHTGTYWEPFVGGGAMFFTMANRIDRAILSDTNEELIITYQEVKNNVSELIEVLRMHEVHHKNESYYLHMRAQQPEIAIEIAARFIYLNKTCYNGLYRVNKAGKFNVPKGRYKNPAICNESSLHAASAVLQKAIIKLGSFKRVVKPGADDFIYCDPPYHNCFTEYQAGGFSEDDQECLHNTVNDWIESGAMVMLSNSDTPFIRRLYRGGAHYRTHSIEATRFINSKASGRGASAKVIITSYD